MNFRTLVIVVIVFFILFSCSEDNPTNTNTPKIAKITPAIANIGGIVTITGTNFGATQDKNYVTFKYIKASDYTFWSNTKIIIKVPIMAISGKLSVTVNGIKSNDVDFSINPVSPDGYESIRIGFQNWLTKNLDVDHYRNGDPIPEVKDSAQWANLKTGAWCYYKNDPSLGAIYGKLYNWYALNDSRGLAPEGWHIACDEWWELENFLGYDYVAGGRLKSTGTDLEGNGLWFSPNEGATNEYGFSALPGGWRGGYGVFTSMGGSGNWWIWSPNEEITTKTASYKFIQFNSAYLRTSTFAKECGMSVRCVKD